ncbi:MAG: hypothetical protein M1820_003339 [Bogoriella megaspora]|nr:MAG: hypothetical protein M1820_003339 [Bogoriella megaspora]
MTSMFGRISFCVFLLYLLGPTKKIQRTVLWTNIIQQVAINVVMLIQIYAQCGSKIAALWDQEVAAHAKCQSPNVETDLAFAQSALNSVCDLVLAILPPFMLWDLHMPKATKYGLISVLMLSIFGFAASLVKLVEIKNLGARGDFTWNMVNLQTWVVVENNIVLMYASIPVLRPLVFQKKPGSSKNSRFESMPKNEASRGSRKTKESVIDRIKYGSNSKSLTTDGASEEYILQPTGKDQIVRTTELQVTSSASTAYQNDPSKDRISFS